MSTLHFFLFQTIWSSLLNHKNKCSIDNCGDTYIKCTAVNVSQNEKKTEVDIGSHHDTNLRVLSVSEQCQN